MAKADPGTGGRRRRRRRKGTPRDPGQNAGTAAQKGPKALLRQKASTLNEPRSSSQTFAKKKHPLKEENGQQDPRGAGGESVAQPKPAGKKDSGPPARSPPSAKGKSKKADKNSEPKSAEKRARSSADSSPPVAEPNPKRAERDKNSNGTKSDGKGCKEKRKNGNIEKEKSDVKHKKRKAEDTAQQPKEPDIWFDDVDPKDIEAAIGPEAAEVARRKLGLKTGQFKQSVEQVLVKEKSSDGLTRAVAMDCEMVGVGPGGEDSIVARVSIVNRFGKCVYDKYVKPTEKVTDYRTAVSGIRPEHLKKGEDFKTVQKEVAAILNGRILVGHAVHNDLKVLLLDHPKKKIRDTQKYKPFRQMVKIQDAQAAMRLYTLEKKKWEAALKNKPKGKL
ncbi:UNVERIFIED_CONTAM: hypothetical protein H355_006729 [Colinus virginianus]|nr:hypothetical protein H355_006729 [Colinus virginianus]